RRLQGNLPILRRPPWPCQLLFSLFSTGQLTRWCETKEALRQSRCPRPKTSRRGDLLILRIRLAYVKRVSSVSFFVPPAPAVFPSAGGAFEYTHNQPERSKFFS